MISTLDRASSLGETLDALRLLRGVEFEVIVVNGPSSDETEALVTGHRGGARLVRCAERNLSMSRNIGIAAARGEIVAFVDDDAVPEPHWLEALLAAYEDNRVVGAGGPVLDGSGGRFQYEYSRSDRIGRTRFDGQAHSPRELAPGADPFPYLQGTNMSFRRAALVELGGFDEEIEYNYDEVDVCLRLIDAGGSLRHVSDAYVLHRRLASQLRNENGIYVDPFPVIKNRFYFALRHGLATRSQQAVIASLHEFVDDFKDGTVSSHRLGLVSASELELFLNRIDEAIESGTERGLHGTRRSARFAEPDPAVFQHYRLLRRPQRLPRLARVSARPPVEPRPPGVTGAGAN